VHGKTTNVVGMGLKRRDLLASRQVEHTELEVVGARDELESS
jgi:hypothetical protein